jgi:hypothetical protein
MIDVVEFQSLVKFVSVTVASRTFSTPAPRVSVSDGFRLFCPTVPQNECVHTARATDSRHPTVYNYLHHCCVIRRPLILITPERSTTAQLVIGLLPDKNDWIQQ